MPRLVFLLGSGPAYEIIADEFVAASGASQAQIVALVQTMAGWQKYQAEITRPWIQRGVSKIIPIMPDENGILNLDKVIANLRHATGIFIGGGNTPTYHKLYTAEPIKSIIRDRHLCDGVPIVGVSAGALIALEICQLTPDETGEREIKIVQGLELAKGFVVGVHFTEWNALPEVLDVMRKTRTPLGLGIDESACAVCEDGRFARVLGKSVHRIEMFDFDNTEYQITEGF